jgi:hypothetical protein
MNRVVSVCTGKHQAQWPSGTAACPRVPPRLLRLLPRLSGPLTAPQWGRSAVTLSRLKTAMVARPAERWYREISIFGSRLVCTDRCGGALEKPNEYSRLSTPRVCSRVPPRTLVRHSRLGCSRECLRVNVLPDVRHLAISNGHGKDEIIFERPIRGLHFSPSEASHQHSVSLRDEFWRLGE